MTPTKGRIVLYELSVEDAAAINRRRNDGSGIESLSVSKSGGIVHVGSPVEPGDIAPMMITAVYSEDVVNGQVFLDGNDSLWVKGVVCGNALGRWHWPKRE